MGKKAKSRSADRQILGGATSDFESALQKLKSTNLEVILNVLETSILDISRTDEFTIQDRQNALTRLLGVVLAAARQVKPKITKKPLWKDRPLWKEQTPFDFLSEAYSDEIASGSLTKSDLRARDFPLYQALSSTHWKAKVKASNSFSRLPTKRQSHDDAVALLPVGITRSEIINLLPREFQELFRLVHVAEMRRHRTSK